MNFDSYVSLPEGMWIFSPQLLPPHPAAVAPGKHTGRALLLVPSVPSVPSRQWRRPLVMAFQQRPDELRRINWSNWENRWFMVIYGILRWSCGDCMVILYRDWMGAYPLVKHTKKAIEHGHLLWIYPWTMVIFHIVFLVYQRVHQYTYKYVHLFA